MRQSGNKEKEKVRSKTGREDSEREENLEPDTSIDLENEQWATSPPEKRLRSPKVETSEFYIDKSQNYTQNY